MSYYNPIRRDWADSCLAAAFCRIHVVCMRIHSGCEGPDQEITVGSYGEEWACQSLKGKLVGVPLLLGYRESNLPVTENGEAQGARERGGGTPAALTTPGAFPPTTQPLLAGIGIP